MFRKKRIGGWKRGAKGHRFMDISIDLSMVLLSSAISDPIPLISEHRSLQEAPYTYVKTAQYFVYWEAASRHARWSSQ